MTDLVVGHGSTLVETDENKYSSMIALHHALHGKPVEFQDEINGLLANRITDAIEKRREEVAREVFGDQVPEVQTVDSEGDQDNGNTEEAGEPELESESVEETPEEE